MIAKINAAARRTPTWLVYGAALGLVAWALYSAILSPDPAKVLERELGKRGLQILVASLCITPLRWGGINLLKFRRALGLMGFMFIGLHLFTWSVLDLGLRWDVILTDLTKRPYIIIGFLAFVALIPLALTSNAWSIKRLGALRWRKLHWLAYPAILAGAVHFVMIGKVYTLESGLYLAAVAGLLIARWAKTIRNLRPAV
jgi:methionine sulfoxide reductase heme-binding subunit